MTRWKIYGLSALAILFLAGGIGGGGLGGGGGAGGGGLAGDATGDINLVGNKLTCDVDKDTFFQCLVDDFLVFTGTSISSPGAGSQSEQWGSGATAAIQSTSVGFLADCDAQRAVCMGRGSKVSTAATGGISIGRDANLQQSLGSILIGEGGFIGASAGDTIVIGRGGSGSSFSECIVIGALNTCQADNEGRWGSVARPTSFLLFSTADFTLAGRLELPTQVVAAPTEPVACDATTMGATQLVDDNDDSALSVVCICLSPDDATFDWRRLDDNATACPFY